MTRQGNKLGRSAVIEQRAAALSTDFGLAMLRNHFPEIADDVLARVGVYSRGPRKGQARGYIHWEKVIEGGFDYRTDRRSVVRRGTQCWRVLDGPDERFSNDVGAMIAGERIKAQQEAEAARRAAMTPREHAIERAMRARRSAHEFRRMGDDFGMEEFRYYIGRARQHVRFARTANQGAE